MTLLSRLVPAGYPGRVTTSGPAAADRSATQPGLRERKAAATRRALREQAARLFAERGFGPTGVADIAAAAGVSERTFFRYFDSKEDLLLPDLVSLFAQVEAELAVRPIGEAPLAAVRAALAATSGPFAASTLAVLSRPFEGTGGVIAQRLVYAFAGFEQRLAELVRERMAEAEAAGCAHGPGFGDGRDPDLFAEVTAGAALSAVRATLRTMRYRYQNEEEARGREQAEKQNSDTSEEGGAEPAERAPQRLLLRAFAMLNEIGDEDSARTT